MAWRAAVRSSLLFLLLAVASLGLKAAALDFDVAPDQERLVADLAASLRAQGFIVRIERYRYLEPAVLAIRGSCVLRARDGGDAGLTQAYAYLARGLGPGRFIYAGVVRDDLPVLRLEARDQVQRTLARLGVATARPAPVAVFATPGCDLAAIDLSTVMIHPRGRSR